ncbi:MAG: transporter [Saprospiraceae bacterium]|nr:MAG: transporter [Saprospiraceae bacterium]
MQTIDIKTTQNVTIEYELATLWERMLAIMIDAIIVGAIYMILALLLSAAFSDGNGNSDLSLGMIYSLLPVICFLLYQLLSEVFADGQSWGKKSMSIKVVRLDGQEPGLSDYLLRSVFHIVDTIFSGGILAALLISSSNKNQRLGDMTANTTVIRLRSSLNFQLNDILKISSLEDYEPHYPEVKKLSESDMLLIKGTISRYRNHPNDAHKKVIVELVTHLKEVLEIEDVDNDKIEFLKTLIRDYIVLTR